MDVVNATYEDMAKYQVSIKLKDSHKVSEMQLMKFKSELSAQLDATSEMLLDYRSLKSTIEMSTLLILIMMGMIMLILFFMAFYQIIL